MNKIKGSSSAVKMKYLLFVFAAAVLVSLPTRVYQLLALVDTTNGFFKESDVTIPVLYGVVVVFGLLFLVLSFISKEVPSPKLPTGKNPVLGVASFVMVAGLGVEMFSILKKIIPANQGSGPIFISLLKSNLAKNGGTFMILEFVFAFFAIIYFVVFAISHLNGKASYKEFKILALAPLCWSMTVLITKLMNAISFIKVSELLFEIFMFVLVMLFFLTFARISSGVFTEDSMWGIYGYGLAAALLASIVTIPRIVIALVGLDAVEGNEFNFAHLTVFVFILAYIFASLGIGFKDGIKNRRTVNELELSEVFEAATKKDDINSFFAGEDEEENVEDILEFDAVINAETEDTVNDSEILINEDYTEIIEESIDFEPQEAIEKMVEEIVEETEEETVEIIVEETVEEIPETTVAETVEETVEIIEEPVEEIVEEASPNSVFQALEFSEAIPETPKKKKSKLFKKSPKMKQAPSRKDAGDSELTAISLADLKNKNKE